MDGDFSEKLNRVLSDPDMIAKITAVASGVGKTEEPKNRPDIPVSVPSVIKDDRIRLIESLKPLLRDEKRKKLDSLVSVMTVISLTESLKPKNGRGDKSV